MEKLGALDMDKVCERILVLGALFITFVASCCNLLLWIYSLSSLKFQIYHARFYDMCKGRMALDEAFRFTKLISNPTLSTFNMLMSVCAISLDLEG